MAYPSLEDFTNAMQHINTSLIDNSLKNGKIETSGLGLPVVRSGGFALTFKVRVSGSDYAVRCFHKERKGLAERYGAVSRKLKVDNLPEIVKFDFIPAGVRIRSMTYPIVKMDWVEGTTLGSFIENNKSNASKLINIKNKLKQLSANLITKNVAHGDVQTNNIIVDKNENLLLVDYDAFFVPEISNLGAIEAGHRNFQHPERLKNSPFDADLDRFSFCLMDVALSALIEKPKIWEDLEADPDALLFRQEDFVDPKKSETFQVLASLPKSGSEVRKLATVSIRDYRSVPTLASFTKIGMISETEIPKKILVQNPNVVTKQEAKPGYVSNFILIDARDINACFQNVNNFVEVIGKVRHVRFSTTKYGQEFIHLILSDQGGKGIHINIWAEGIAALRRSNKLPTKSIQGSWISVTGLMEPAYATKTWERVSLTVTDPNQLTRLTPGKALWMLESTTSANKSTNGIKTQSRSTSSNKNTSLLSQLDSGSSSKSRTSTGRPSGSYSYYNSRGKKVYKQRNYSSTPTYPGNYQTSRSTNPGCFSVIMFLGGLYILAILFSSC